MRFGKKTCNRNEILSIKWSYGAGNYSIDGIDLKKSPYYGLYPSVNSLDFLPYYSMVDDPVIKEMAEQLEDQFDEYTDERRRSSIILAMIQENIAYASDEERFGRDLWEPPVLTLLKGEADCDGMALLYTSVAYNLGLDVITVVVEGHMCAAVNVFANGTFYEFEGKKYYHVESTADLPAVGRYWDSARQIGMARPATPTSEFRRTLLHTV